MKLQIKKVTIKNLENFKKTQNKIAFYDGNETFCGYDFLSLHERYILKCNNTFAGFCSTKYLLRYSVLLKFGLIKKYSKDNIDVYFLNSIFENIFDSGIDNIFIFELSKNNKYKKIIELFFEPINIDFWKGLLSKQFILLIESNIIKSYVLRKEDYYKNEHRKKFAKINIL